MNEKEYKPIDVQDFLQGIDIEKLKESLTIPPQTKPPKIETMNFLLASLDIGGDIAYPDLFLRNYIYTTIIIRKHLREINTRQRNISNRMKKVTDKGSYLFKKLQFFYERNQSAKDEIIKFISYGLGKYVADIKGPYGDLIDRDNEKNMWLLGPVYSYQYDSHFYDPDYDFSTYTKFYNIPGVGVLDFMENIERHIALKRERPDDYYREVIKVVDDNNMVSQMSSRVSFNYHVHERKEIFETLATLFEEKR